MMDKYPDFTGWPVKGGIYTRSDSTRLKQFNRSGELELDTDDYIEVLRYIPERFRKCWADFMNFNIVPTVDGYHYRVTSDKKIWAFWDSISDAKFEYHITFSYNGEIDEIHVILVDKATDSTVKIFSEHDYDLREIIDWLSGFFGVAWEEPV